MSVKHGHHHDIDTEGTDSWRLRHEGGAEKVVLAGPEGFAVMGIWGAEGEAEVTGETRHFWDMTVDFFESVEKSC